MLGRRLDRRIGGAARPAPNEAVLANVAKSVRVIAVCLIALVRKV